MKNTTVAIAAIICLTISSCSVKKEETGMSVVAKNNLEAIRGITQCFKEKNFTDLGKYVAEDCIDHSGVDGDLKGLAQMKAEYEKWAPMFDMSKRKVIKELADDEYAMVWMSFEGTMQTDDMGLKKGMVFEKTDVEIARFKDGKVVEHWTMVQPDNLSNGVPQSIKASAEIKN